MFEITTKNEGILVVGGDDSNHAGTAEGEIIVATFSFLLEDSIVKKFPNNRNMNFVYDWLNSDRRDFRFARLKSNRYRHCSTNLVEVIPKLIHNYMEEENLFVKTLKIYLDGILCSGDRTKLRNKFTDFRGIEKVVVDNFTKKRNNRIGKVTKYPECPSVVYCADVLSNYLYSIQFQGMDVKLLNKIAFVD